MDRTCIKCSADSCYRWYRGPTCANCYRRAAYKADPTKLKSQSKAYRERHPDKNREQCRASYTRHKDVRLASVKKWIKENPEKAKAYQRISSERNREKLKAYQRRHYRENKALYRAKDARYRAAKLKATPLWADLEAIKQFYMACPPGFHVDHIIPLQGKTVCGLHVLENLQYLPAKDNLSKGNRYVA